MSNSHPVRRNNRLPWNDERRPVLYFVAEMESRYGGVLVIFVTADIDEAFEYAEQLLNDDLESEPPASPYTSRGFHFDALSIIEQRGDVVMRGWRFNCLDGTAWVSWPNGDVYQHQPALLDVRRENLVGAAEAIMNQSLESS